MLTTSHGWFFWAALSACFAALTAIFAKIGIQGVDSDFATLIRTIFIVFVLGAFVWLAGKWSDPRNLSTRTLTFENRFRLASCREMSSSRRRWTQASRTMRSK